MEVDANGGASVVNSYISEISKLTEAEQLEFVDEYFRVVWNESDEGVADHVLGVVHGASAQLPDLVEHFGLTYPTMPVKVGTLGSPQCHTMTMAEWHNMVHHTYRSGTFRCGPLLQVSLVGTVHEEVWNFFFLFYYRVHR